jgi:predicted ester cyclase
MPDLTANRVQELTFTTRLARNTKAILFNTHRSWSTDQHATIEDLVAEGDKVACRWSGRATHQGDLMGVAATAALKRRSQILESGLDERLAC